MWNFFLNLISGFGYNFLTGGIIFILCSKFWKGDLVLKFSTTNGLGSDLFHYRNKFVNLGLSGYLISDIMAVTF